MRTAGRYLIVGLAIGFYVGCSPKRFEKDDSRTRCQGSSQVCISDGRTDSFDYVVVAPGTKVDILFVNDNSGSMSFEQNNMATRFNNFIQALDSQGADYRIGIVTTDVSSTINPARSINLNGGIQDGRLVRFGDGSKYITSATANRVSLFAQAIQRPETKTCENFLVANPNSVGAAFDAGILANCPSPDERGIFAANLFVTSNPESFIRANTHLAIIFLADEDVRSSLYYKQGTSYKLEANDLPQTLISNIQSIYPNKTMSMHSIIVRPGALKSGVTAEAASTAIAAVINSKGQVDTSKIPSTFFSTLGDTACLNQQSSQINANQMNAVSGSVGYMYSLASKMTGGIEGDICANDYGTLLSNIGGAIGDRLNEIRIECVNPKDLKVEFEPTSNGSAYTVEGKVVKFQNTLSPGTKVRLSYSCPTI